MAQRIKINIKRSKKLKPLRSLDSTLEERIINSFPEPYSTLCTPYKDIDFPDGVETLCRKLSAEKSEMLRLSKVIVIGDVAVGKTCLVRRFCFQPFDTNYKATIGVDFEAKKFYILDLPYILQIWDTAGQEKFKCIASSYYRGAKVVILVFDFCHLSSLYNIPVWLERAQKCIEKPILFLVGTKQDMVASSSYKLTEDEAIKIANSIGAEYWPVSSKTGENIEGLINRVASISFTNDILKELEVKDETKNESFIKINTKASKKKEKCAPCS